MNPRTSSDIFSSLRCNRRSASQPRSQGYANDLPTTPRSRLHAQGFVEELTGRARGLAADAAAVATPVLLAGGALVAGTGTGAAFGSQLAGDAVAGALGEWSRGPASSMGTLIGGIAGSSVTNTAMTVASSCPHRAVPTPPRVTPEPSPRLAAPRRSSRPPPVRRPKAYAMNSDSEDSHRS